MAHNLPSEMKSTFSTLTKLAELAKLTYRDVLKKPNAFTEVGVGADKLPTSLIDAKLEKICIDFLADTNLVHTIISEEAGLINISKTGRFIAVLDPLDGTSNASMRFPYCALSLALYDADGPVMAMVANYDTEDVFFGFRHYGSFRNGNRLAVSNNHNPSNSCLVTSRPLNEDEAFIYSRLLTKAKRIRITSSPALDICHVACGSFSAYVDFHILGGLIHKHDIAAAKLILEEAGGIILNERGFALEMPDSIDSSFNLFALNSQESFDWIAEALNLSTSAG